MRRGEQLPRVAAGADAGEGLVEMSRKGLVLAAVTDATDRLLGVFTDGDLRRVLDRGLSLRATTMAEAMTQAPRVVRPEQLAADAVNSMQEHRVTALLVVDAESKLVRPRVEHPRPAAGRGRVDGQGMRIPARLTTRLARRIELLVLDVDGTLTDGSLWYGPRGEQLKRFHVRDGHGIKLLAAAGRDAGGDLGSPLGGAVRTLS